ncbi:MAG: caspase family protein [Bacteroidia bacterium]|nr:caspase family protein [Bacteroidia bacterium]
MRYPQRLLGLFIGIDDFKYVTDLGGCVKDIQKVKNYLIENLPEGMDSKVKTLFNQEASKDAIVGAFNDFLIQEATEDDVVLMYFSGHGAQEEADEVWWSIEADKGLEGLCCHDTGFGPGTATLLGDKELRFLISKLAQKGCDIITIFDACHSGDATRTSNESYKARRLTGALPKRKWEDFIFSDQISREDVARLGWNKLVPEGRHLQLAACEDRELAYENAFGGVFTHNLIQVLKDTKGQVSYFDLQSKIKFAIKGAEGDITQTPQVHVAYGFEGEVFKQFLSRDPKSAPNYGNLSYNMARSKWIFDKGEIHGIKVGDSSDSLVAIPLDDGKTTYAGVESTESGFSILAPQNLSKLINSKNYTGFAKGLFNTITRIAVEGDTATQNAIKEFYEAKKDAFRGIRIEWVEEELMADFVIRGVEVKGPDGALDNYIVITNPEDHKPLTFQVRGQRSEKSLETVFASLEMLSKWHFVKLLNNPNSSSLTANKIEFEIFHKGNSLGTNNSITVIQPELVAPESVDGLQVPVVRDLKISIKNQDSRPLYVACIYMGAFEEEVGDYGNTVSFGYALKPSILQPQVTILESGHTTHLAGGEALSFNMNPHYWQFNWPSQKIGFKVIASRGVFDVQAYDSLGVEVPVFPWPDRSGEKALSFEKARNVESAAEWQAWTFWVEVINPHFKS